MNRKITELEQKLIDDGWYLNLKRYTGKRSDKIECYEYHKTSDIRNDGKTYDQIIKLDQKRSQIVSFGIGNLAIEYMSEEELTFVRFLYFELKHFVEKLTVVEEPFIYVPNLEYDERKELGPMTPEQFDELCQEQEKEGN